MTTITRERLLKIQSWRETYGAGSNVMLPAEEAEELARIALASLEAKPIGAFHIADQQVDGTTDYIRDGEWPIDNGVIEVYAAPQPLSDEEREELQERRQADSAEPACYALTNMAGEVYNTHSSAQNAGAYRDLIHQSDDSLTLRVTPLYAAPPAPVTGIYDDVLNIIGLLENNEWAEHCTSTALGSLLESEITRLVGKEQSAPVVLDEEQSREAFEQWCSVNIERKKWHPEFYAHLPAREQWAEWEACRTAMLQGSQPVSNRDELPVIGWLRSDYNSDDKRDPNAPLFMLGSNDPSEAWGVKYIPLSGNSPVIPDGYALVPVEPTDEMIEAAMNCDDVTYNKSDDTVFYVHHREIYKAMLAAAPQQGTTNL